MMLRTKLLVSAVTVPLLTGALIAGWSKYAMHRITVNETATRALLNTADVSRWAAEGFQTGNEPLLLPLLQLTQQRTGAVYAAVISPARRILAHTNVAEVGKLDDSSRGREVAFSTGSTYRELRGGRGEPILEVSLPLQVVERAGTPEEVLLFGGQDMAAPHRSGTLRLGLSLRDARATEGRIFRQILGIVTCSSLLIMLGAVWLIRGVLGRLHLLIDGTQRIGRGEHGVSVPVQGHDELSELTNNFNAMSRDIALRNREMESFIYTVSHDLKAPLLSLQGMAALLLEDYANALGSDGRRMLDRLMSNTQFMERLIGSLLTVSRLGRGSDIPEPADVRSVIVEVGTLLDAQLRSRGMTLSIERNLPSFYYDRLQLTQLFQNLVSNAAKFMGSQPHPRIEIGGTDHGATVEYYVRDNGIGIDPAYHEKIFSVFQRLQDVQVEGTGIGLSVVRKIVGLAGGTISVESAKGQGATFRIRFPRASAPAPGTLKPAA